MENYTTHQFISGSANSMETVADGTVALVVTSPPYPMIDMWDDIFSLQNPEISDFLLNNESKSAFEAMHQLLDEVWTEVARVLIPGGIACINIGDATRTLGGNFQLFPNHSRIINAFQKLGMHNLPNIIWRKQTNAPNKFMGSGMLPAGAYVTLEHEWILIFRKEGKRNFITEKEKTQRRESAYFWEERNIWFSDLWDFKGIKQNLNDIDTRKRSGAFPFELPYRLINMFSIYGDIVLDPFVGTGTTSIAAIASNRNSIGFDIDSKFIDSALGKINFVEADFFNSEIKQRINRHQQFIANRIDDITKSDIKYFNKTLNAPVVTAQETDIKFYYVDTLSISDYTVIANYCPTPPSEQLFNTIKSRPLQKSIFD